MARAASARVLDEDDDDLGGVEHAASEVDLPSGLSDRGEGHDGAGEGEYQIVETDDDFQPLTGPAARQEQEIRGDDDGGGEGGGHRRDKLSGAQRRKVNRERQLRNLEELRLTRQENERLRAEFDALKNNVTPRLDRIDQGRYNDQLAGLNRDIDHAASTVNDAQERMSEAIVAGDAQGHTQALREYTQALQRGNELSAQRERLEATRTEPDDPRHQPDQRQPAPRQAAPPPMDPEIRERTLEFVRQFPWMDLNSARPDRDTRIALMIDSEIVQDGFNPRDDDYWEELEARLREAPQLAHRFSNGRSRVNGNGSSNGNGNGRQVPAQRRGPMVGGAGGGGAPSGTPRQVMLSPERKQALMDVGALDRDGRTIADRAKFNRLAKAYSDFDRENPTARQ